MRFQPRLWSACSPAHLHSLIRVFAVYSVGSQEPNVSSCGAAKTLIRLDDAQVDLSLRWAHRSFCWFCLAAAQRSKAPQNLRETFGSLATHREPSIGLCGCAGCSESSVQCKQLSMSLCRVCFCMVWYHPNVQPNINPGIRVHYSKTVKDTVFIWAFSWDCGSFRPP